MPKEYSCTGYNAPNPPMASLRIRRWHMRLAFCGVLFMATSAMASDWSAREKQLAAKIIAVSGQSALSVRVENRSSLSQAEAAQIKSGLLSELTSLGARLADSNQAAASVQITLSEQLQNYVWVAEIRRGSQPASVVPISIPYSEVPASAQNSGMFSIRKLFLWSQPEKVLDAVISNNPQRAIILGADSVSILRSQNGGIWQLEQTLPISHEQPWPRDLRGRLVLRNDHLFDAYLPGVFCQSTAISPFAMNCGQSNAPWPLSPGDSTASAFFANDQNFFAGTITLDKGAQKSVPAFFSAALLSLPENSAWILSGVDGHAYIADNSWIYKAVTFNVGSDIASIHSSCGTGWQLLTTTAPSPAHTQSGAESNDRAIEDQNQSKDSLQAFEIVDQEFIPVSPSLNFTGVINALWTHSNHSDVTAVVHNNTAGDYQAYQLTISCGQ